MTDDLGSRPPWSFWAIAGVMLVWNALGVMNFFAQMSPDLVASYRESERAIIEGRPAWATSAFAVAVLGGAAGCLLLLLRNRAAKRLLFVSLAGVVVTLAHSLGLDIEFGAGEIAGILLMPILVAVFLVWYAGLAERRGWVR